MLAPRYWHVRPKDYREPARGALYLLVSAYRQCGGKTIAALETMAPALEMPARRPRRIFENDRAPFVSADEYTLLLLRGAMILRRIADRLREKAARWDSEADEMERKYREMWGEKCRASGEKRAA